MPAVDGQCAECGFDYDGTDSGAAPEALRGLGRRYRAPLTRLLAGEDPDTVLRARPEEGTWSALEYTCHVRDVLAVQRERLLLALATERPIFEPMGRDERAVDDAYNDQDPVAVADELAANAEALAAVVEGLDAGQLARTAVYGYPEPTERTLEWVVRHTLHEGSHHLLDIGRGLRAVRGR